MADALGFKSIYLSPRSVQGGGADDWHNQLFTSEEANRQNETGAAAYGKQDHQIVTIFPHTAVIPTDRSTKCCIHQPCTNYGWSRVHSINYNYIMLIIIMHQ